MIFRTIKTFGETRRCRRFVLILFAHVADTDGFVGRLIFSLENDHIKRYCAKVTSKKRKLPRDGREEEVRRREGMSEVACDLMRNLLPLPGDSFFQRRLFFSREKKSASSRSTVHTIRCASAVYVLQIAREGKTINTAKHDLCQKTKNRRAFRRTPGGSLKNYFPRTAAPMMPASLPSSATTTSVCGVPSLVYVSL